MKLLRRIFILCAFSCSLFSLHACGSDDVAEEVATVKLTCTPSSFTFPADGGQDSFTVEANREFSVFAEEEWVKVTPSSGMSGSTVVTVKVEENKTYANDPRTATVVVKSGTKRFKVGITQDSPKRPSAGEISCPIDGYNLVWNDEFNKDGYLSSDWTHEVKGDHWVNNELQNYVNTQTPNGAKVTEIKDGVLRINCLKENGKVYSGRVYAKVKEGWKYGYIEARIKLPKGKGTWPAFWMMPVNFRSWPTDGEIDIMEEVGANANYVSSSLHADGHVHTNNTQVTHEMYCKGAEDDFHVYAMEWTAKSITTYVDGIQQLYYANPGTGNRDWPYDAPFYVILNLAWGGDWGGYRGIDESALPTTMEVDYVRVFQK